MKEREGERERLRIVLLDDKRFRIVATVPTYWDMGGSRRRSSRSRAEKRRDDKTRLRERIEKKEKIKKERERERDRV